VVVWDNLNTHVSAEILEHLRELHAEVQARGELLVKYAVPAVTRELASKGVGLHPLVCLLEEAHVAIQHKTHGAEIAQLLVDIVRLGRKRGIHLIVSTQASTKDSMPGDVTRNCSNGIAFAVGDHVANDALLGQGAYAAGHRADLRHRPRHRGGQGLQRGALGDRAGLLPGRGQVQRPGEPDHRARPGGDRGAGQRVAWWPVLAPQIETSRDLLEDLDAVLGSDPVPAADVPALLARHAPKWAPYRSLNGKALVAQLARKGVKVPSTGNRWPVKPEAVRAALAKRATADLDE
jgi:S-DNA-T family DNA segregation ATPase FtsK/SpoIIIE